VASHIIYPEKFSLCWWEKCVFCNCQMKCSINAHQVCFIYSTAQLVSFFVGIFIWMIFLLKWVVKVPNYIVWPGIIPPFDPMMLAFCNGHCHEYINSQLLFNWSLYPYIVIFASFYHFWFNFCMSDRSIATHVIFVFCLYGISVSISSLLIYVYPY
jgi:hypothetical protein